jgi:type VI secretion system protein ImpE
MAPVLEVFAPEGYFWVGWREVQFLDVLRPQSLLDLLWAPARLGLHSGVIGAVVVPGLYSTSWNHADELVRLGRRNEWIDLGAGLVRGAGAKVYDVGGQNKALVELQGVEFDIPAASEVRQRFELDA